MLPFTLEQKLLLSLSLLSVFEWELKKELQYVSFNSEVVASTTYYCNLHPFIPLFTFSIIH